MNTAIGQREIVFRGYSEIKICSVWEFIRNVRTEYSREYYQIHTQVAKTAFESMGPYHRFGPDVPVFQSTVHTLLQNPMKLLTELKRTTTQVKFTKSLSLAELIEEMAVRSVQEYGKPTHCFTVGANLYAFVCEEDIRLFVNDKMQQQLVCTAPQRNFIVRAENLEFNV